MHSRPHCLLPLLVPLCFCIYPLSLPSNRPVEVSNQKRREDTRWRKASNGRMDCEEDKHSSWHTDRADFFQQTGLQKRKRTEDRHSSKAKHFGEGKKREERNRKEKRTMTAQLHILPAVSFFCFLFSIILCCLTCLRKEWKPAPEIWPLPSLSTSLKSWWIRLSKPERSITAKKRQRITTTHRQEQNNKKRKTKRWKERANCSRRGRLRRKNL